MILCRITGDVFATVKDRRLASRKLLLAQPVDLDARTPQGGSFLAIDAAQAGTGDLVLCIREGSCCRLIFDDPRIPVEAVVVAVVDDLEVVRDEKALAGTAVTRPGGARTPPPDPPRRQA